MNSTDTATAAQAPVDADDIVALTERYSANNYAPLPVVLARGEGAWVWDVAERRYLDCISAYSSLNQGHRHPRIIEALTEQASRLTLTSRAVHNDQMGPFLAELCRMSGFDKALPMNTGVEAVETAIKLARKWGYVKKRVSRDAAEIIVCRNNFHGRSTTVVGFSSEPDYKEGFGPYPTGFVTVEFGDASALEAAISDNTVAFLVEPIQAEAGVITPPDGYLARARHICRANNVLFMLDEIQTGLGRTGHLFAYEHEQSARPDVLIVGKALGGGVYPVSAVLAAADVMGVLKPGDHGSTFGGNPLAAAVARAAIDVTLDEELSQRALSLGARLVAAIRSWESVHIGEVRGRGLLLGIEILASSGTAQDFAHRLMDRGILSKDTHKQVLRIAPPLIIEPEEMEWLIEHMQPVFS